MTDTGPTTRLSGLLKAYLPADERVVVSHKPSLWFIVLIPLRLLVVLVIVWAGAAWGAALMREAKSDAISSMAPTAWWIAIVFGTLIAVRLLWQSLEWLARLYVLTDRRVIRVGGVLRQQAVEIRLDRIQNITVSRTIRERVFGLGTLGFSAAGTAWTEIAWVMIPKPHDALTRARDAIAGKEGTAVEDPRPIIIGLAGGVASGKSEVAAQFAALGCVVSDSDVDAKKALDRPEVRSQLVKWWGEDVLDESGRIDRKKVAAIVFEKPDERKRLEGLIHPLVHTQRVELVKRAKQEGAPAVVIDAPLLYEAGVDRECDAVVFVDTPPEERLRRAIESRGWDESEFERRESAQLAVETKRSRSDFEIRNSGDRAELARLAAELLAKIRATHAG